MSNKLIDLNALSEYKTKSDLKYQDKLTAGNNVTISSNVISVTPEYGDTSTIIVGNQSVPNNTIYELGSVTLTPGIYIIGYTCTFDTNATGYRQCGFSTNTTDITGYGRAWGDTRVAASGAMTQTEVVGIANITSSTKFYFLAKQNSGGSLTATPRCYYFKF